MAGKAGLAERVPARLKEIPHTTSYWDWGSAASWLTGTMLVLASLVRYTSWSNRSVLGRWSEIHFLIILLFVFLFFAILLYIWKERSTGVTLSAQVLFIRLFVGIGICVWGASVFVSSLEDNAAGGRILDLEPFGSTVPVGIFLEWISMVSFFVALILCVVVAARRMQYKNAAGYKWLQHGLITIVSVCALFLLLEGGTRLVNILRPVTQGFPTKSSDLWFRRFVRVNSLGFRDSERSMQALDGAGRILVIGDSFAFGVGIEDVQQRLTERLQSGLNQLSRGMRFEVINAARPDTNSLDHTDVLIKMLRYQPDYVLLVYVFNDIEHVTRPRRSVLTDMGSPMDRVHPGRILLRNFHFAEQIFVRMRKGLYRYVWNRDGSKAQDPYQIDVILEEHLRALGRFFQIAKEAQAKARLIPFDITVIMEESSVKRYKRFVEAASAKGIRVWPLREAFAGYEYRDLTVNSFDAHPNGLANGLAADVIIKRFQAEFLRDRIG